jgi:TPR repeat protein
MGEMYYNGKGVKQDFKKAFEWYQRSVESGDLDALYSIGFMYCHGQGVEQDFEKASEFWKNAMEQGCEISENEIRVSLAQAKAEAHFEAWKKSARDYLIDHVETKAIDFYNEIDQLSGAILLDDGDDGPLST